ncbi:hypothetical protein ACQ4M3_09560 [Leptolyngbya sp. AN03gr2]|uniref:hypothetical protein n=1 Tax=Leptolyngbya sp. AN03gr2 TaxID=3423364 RepID=UPI003D314914
MNLIPKQEAANRLSIAPPNLDAIFTGALQKGLRAPDELGPDVKSWAGYPENYLALLQEVTESLIENRDPNLPERYAQSSGLLSQTLKEVDRHFAVLKGARRGAERFRLEVEAERAVYNQAQTDYAAQTGLHVQQLQEEVRALANQKARVQYATQQNLAEQCADKTTSALVLYNRANDPMTHHSNIVRDYAFAGLFGVTAAGLVSAATALVPVLKQINYPTNLFVFPAISIAALFGHKNKHQWLTKEADLPRYEQRNLTQALANNLSAMPPGTVQADRAMQLLERVLPAPAPRPVVATPIIAPPVQPPVSQSPQTEAELTQLRPPLEISEPAPTVSPKPAEGEYRVVTNFDDLWNN